jgi:hypothetical protein
VDAQVHVEASTAALTKEVQGQEETGCTRHLSHPCMHACVHQAWLDLGYLARTRSAQVHQFQPALR